MKKGAINLLLWIIAYGLIPPLTLWNRRKVRKIYGDTSGYLLNSAKSIDKWANREFRTLWNSELITAESVHHFGNIDETISSVLGKNQRDRTLTKIGQWLADYLDKKDSNHCEKSINLNVNHQIENFKSLYRK
ncbi:hypothetical protein PG630_10315 [Riemerella anatipestifer]|nr:hypothetical protein [Riemerella anatipestifer]